LPGRSDAAGAVNRIQLAVPRATELVARVELVSSGHALPRHPFSLAVIGSTPRLTP
jgi:hypothetical protein